MTVDDHKPSPWCYQKGCRRPECTAANTLACKKHRISRARNGAKFVHGAPVGGYLAVPASEVGWMLKDLHRTFSWRRLSEICGIDGSRLSEIAGGKRKRVYPSTVATITRTWSDWCGPSVRDDRRYPAGPLLRLLYVTYANRNSDCEQNEWVSAAARAAADVGPNLSKSYDRQLHRAMHDGFTVDQCEFWCCKVLGTVPVLVWPDYGQPEDVEETA